MKHILITGGTGGIGRQLTAAFVANGHRVTIWGRSEEEFSALQKEVSQGSELLSFTTIDVSDAKQVTAAAAQLTSLDVLINAAAVLWPVQLFLDSPLDQIHTALNINLHGIINTCYSLLPALQNSGHGKIINFGGGGAGEGRKSHMAYSVSKTGVVRFTENLAIEYSTVDVNVIAPGRHNTGMWNDETFDERPNDWGNMEQLIEFFHFLIGEDSNGITGKFINVKDHWKDTGFVQQLKDDADFLTLRRIDDFKFTAVKK